MTEFRAVQDLKDRQASFNASSRGHWDEFAPHRERVTQLLSKEAKRGSSRLCVLGAGNSNDLDLAALLDVFREVHLIDLDGNALSLGAARQGLAGHPALRLHGQVDVTGAFDIIASWNPLTSVEPAHLHALAGWPIERASRTLPREFDVVISACLLSQLFETVNHALGRTHQNLSAVRRAVLAGHLRLISALTAARGTSILVTEITSSDTLPSLARIPESSLLSLPDRLEREGNVFSHLHRSAFLDAIGRDPVLRDRVKPRETAGVWRWRLHQKVYLIQAMRFQTINTNT